MKRAALYARVSTARQEQEQTIASQIAALETAASALGLQLSSERRYVDDGVSGSRLDRPGLDALRDAAADGLVDVVLIHCPDRLARNFLHQQIVLEELSKRGVDVHFVERPIGERPEDRLLVQMQGVIAEYERAKIVERMRRGRLHKVRTGQMLPFTSPPYGYAIVRTPQMPQGIVVIDEVQAEHVRAMYRWACEENLTTRQIAKRLNERGVAPQRKSFWVASSVQHVLNNPAYTGRAYFGKTEPAEPTKPMKPGGYRKVLKSSHVRRPRSQWMEVAIPAIIEVKMQEQVHAWMGRNTRFSPRNARREYLLRGLVRCGHCGLHLEAAYKRFTGRYNYEYFWYSCRGHHPAVETGRKRKCIAKRVRADELDRVVWEAIVAWLRSPDMLREEVATWKATRAAGPGQARERSRVQAARRQIDLQVERLLDAYQRGALKVDELKARRERLEAMRSEADARQRELQAQALNEGRVERIGDDLAAFASTMCVGLDKLSFVERQRLVHLLVEGIVVKDDRVTIEHAVPLSGRFSGLRPSQGGCGGSRDRGGMRVGVGGGLGAGRGSRGPRRRDADAARSVSRVRARRATSSARRASAGASRRAPAPRPPRRRRPRR
jgi:site-specific DNA recombinase